MNNTFKVSMVVVSLLALGAVAGCAGSAGAEPLPGTISVNLNAQQGISVTGTGKVSVAPDIALITLGIASQADTVARAQADAVAAMDKIMAALTANGVAKKDIQTRYFNIQQVTRYDNAKQDVVIVGYRVTNSVTAKVRDIAKAGPVIDAVADAGGDLARIDGISFTIDDDSAAVKQAREKAMNDAKESAEQMAKLAGVSLGRPVSISENASYPSIPYPVMARDAAAGNMETQISAGELDVTVTVQVIYAIQ